MLIFRGPIQFEEALAELGRKGLLPTTAYSQQLEALRPELKRYSMFSARVANLPFLQRASDLITQMVNPQYAGGAPGTYMDKATFVIQMQQFLNELGYSPEEGEAGTLTDLSSDARLSLIADMNVAKANNLGQAIQGNDPAVLDAFPALELYRAGNFFSQKQRNWPIKWKDAGGHFYGGGRMIAVKDDPIWTRTIDEGGFNRFGDPYPPFDFNSGMRTKPVPRGEAIRLGVMPEDYQVQPQKLTLSDGLQAGVDGIAKALQDAIVASMGGQARIVDGVLELSN